ncbi:peroxisome- protein [Thoreauomyces humboldtii]|nr:peroxisome- protein [Thoreauomyces humboldtii]
MDDQAPPQPTAVSSSDAGKLAAEAIATPPPSPRTVRKVVVKSRPVPIAHDITSLLLSLQGLSQRLSPYAGPVTHWATFALSWRNPYVSSGVVVVFCALVLVGWEWIVHIPFVALIATLGFAYAKRLGRGSNELGQEEQPLPPPSIPHLLHSLISATSSLHSAVDVLDSAASLVTFTRKSETPSVALFRAVVLVYFAVSAAVFCLGLRTVVLLVGLVALTWGSDLGAVVQNLAADKIAELAKQLGVDVQWVDEDDDEDLQTNKDPAAALAQQAQVEALRRGSEVAGRQLMGGPKLVPRPKPTGDGAASGVSQPTRRPVKAGAVKVVKKVTTAPVTPELVVPTVAAKPRTPEPSPVDIPMPAALVAVPAPVVEILPVIVEQDEQPGSTLLASLQASASIEPSTLNVAPSFEGADSASSRPSSSASSSHSNSSDDRVKSRLADVIRGQSPSSTSPVPAVTVARQASPEPVSERDLGPDESNVSVDMHPDWALPGDDDEDDHMTDEFRIALAGSLLRNGKKATYGSLEEDDEQKQEKLQAARSMYSPDLGKVDEARLDEATEAFHKQMMKEEEEEEAHLDAEHFLRLRRSCDSDLTIDALADFSNPRRSSYKTTVPTQVTQRKNRALSNASVSTFSTDASSLDVASSSGPHRMRSFSDADVQHMRPYSITDPLPRLSSIPINPGRFANNHGGETSSAPMMTSPTSSRSSIRGSNRKPMSLVLSFETFENQRWWVGVGWVPHLLPTERGAWTDHAGQKNLPKSGFDLPEFRQSQLENVTGAATSDDQSSSASSPAPDLPLDTNGHRYAWDWDGPWHIDMYGSANGTTDDDGWEYGDNFWTGWKRRKTLKRVVRRRRWVRLARLYEVGRKRSVTFGGSYVFDRQDILDDIQKHQQQQEQSRTPLAVPNEGWPQSQQIASPVEYDDDEEEDQGGHHHSTNIPYDDRHPGEQQEEEEDEEDGIEDTPGRDLYPPVRHDSRHGPLPAQSERRPSWENQRQY